MERIDRYSKSTEAEKLDPVNQDKSIIIVDNSKNDIQVVHE